MHVQQMLNELNPGLEEQLRAAAQSDITQVCTVVYSPPPGVPVASSPLSKGLMLTLVQPQIPCAPLIMAANLCCKRCHQPAALLPVPA